MEKKLLIAKLKSGVIRLISEEMLKDWGTSSVAGYQAVDISGLPEGMRRQLTYFGCSVSEQIMLGALADYLRARAKGEEIVSPGPLDLTSALITQLRGDPDGRKLLATLDAALDQLGASQAA